MTKKNIQQPAKRPVSPTVIWLAVIASTIVTILLYFGLYWLDYQSTSTVSEVSATDTEPTTNEWILIVAIVGAVVLGPSIIVALIVLPIIRKNKKK